MNKHSIMTIALGATLMACSTKNTESDSSDIVGKASVVAEQGVMTPEILYSFGRIADVQVSPEGKILYGVTYISVEKNKSNRELFVMNTDGSEQKQITHTPYNEHNAVWFNKGTQIAFLSTESGSSQIWTMKPDGSARKQISHVEGGIQAFKISPDEKKILLIRSIKLGERATDIYPDLQQCTGRIIDDLMYKHWDDWKESVPHPFVADFDGGSLSNMTDILEGEPYESPMLPFGGMEQLSWSPDGKIIAYTSRKKTGKEYAVSTNSDIFLYDVESKTTRNITEGMMGYDVNPAFSPDGTKIAWQSMERDGYESDKNRLFILDIASGEKTDVTAQFDNNVDAFIWNHDSNTLYALCGVTARTHIYRVDPANFTLQAITSGDYDYSSLQLYENDIIATRRSLSSPDEIFRVNTSDGNVTELSFENKHILDQLTMGKVEERWIKTSDGKQMHTWVIYPPKFDPNKKYPALLYCQGGPQSTVSQFWSYRWNFQMMAANGYIVVAPNRRGVPSFGTAWNEQISGDYGGQNMKDYLSAIDALAQEPYVDKDRLGCTGASYGGFSTYWLAGNHNKRFKAFLAHAGIFNLEAQYLETEEMWFANWDFGGAFWEKDNTTAQRTYQNSPHKFINNWDTPIMITHGEKDYRILASQGMMAFNAAILKGIPARMLVYPDENHWIISPQNGVLFQREFFRWFDQFLKNQDE